jgi:hypothetical protein
MEQNQKNKAIDRVLQSLRRTWIWQAVLFIVGLTTEWRMGSKDIHVLGVLLDAFGVVWTDALVVALVFGLISLVTTKVSPKASTWLYRNAGSMMSWAAVAVLGNIIVFLIALAKL